MTSRLAYPIVVWCATSSWTPNHSY